MIQYKYGDTKFLERSSIKNWFQNNKYKIISYYFYSCYYRDQELFRWAVLWCYPDCPKLCSHCSSLQTKVVLSYELLTGPCSKNDSCYIGKLEISNIKKPSCFVRLIPRYIQGNLPNGFIRVLSAESWKNLTFFPFPQFSRIC